MLAGRQAEIHAERDRKLEEARKQRQNSSAAGCVKNEEGQSPAQPKPRMKWITSEGPVRAGSLADAFGATLRSAHFPLMPQPFRPRGGPISSQFKSAAVLGHVLFNREMCCLAFDRCVIRRLSQEFML